MPSLSPTMERGNIVSWQAKEGDEIKAGDVLAEIETDKATLAFENQEDGYLAKILRPNGSKDIAVGEAVAIIVEDAALIPEFADYTPEGAGAQSRQGQQPEAEAAPAAEVAPAKPSKARQPANARIGPAARTLLAEHGMTVDDIPTPTGPNGIVTKGDVLAALEQQQHAPPAKRAPQPSAADAPAPDRSAQASKSAAQPQAGGKQPRPQPPQASQSGATHSDTPTSQIRKIIAQRLLQSKTENPCVYISVDAEMDGVMAVRKTLAEQGVKVSVNDFVIRAAALALREVAEANAVWDAKSSNVRLLQEVDVAVAVSTDKGLLTPIIKAAHTKSLAQISSEVKALAARARDNKLTPEEFTGGSFTISNLGMYGVAHFSAIVNPPQAAIMAVGGSQAQVRLVDGGARHVAATTMTVTLSADQRLYSAEVAARLLDAFCGHMKAPLTLVM